MRFLILIVASLLFLPNVSAFWEDDNTINASLPDVGSAPTPTVFLKDGTLYLISGESGGTFPAFNWTGIDWQADYIINASLPDVGDDSSPTVFFKDGVLYLISGEKGGTFPAFNWTGVDWQADYIINASLPDVPTGETNPNVFRKDGTWYMLSGSDNQNIPAFNWTGVDWQRDNAINASLGAGRDNTPFAFFKDGTWYNIVGGTTTCRFCGFNWTGNGWQADNGINSGLPSPTVTSPTIFQMNKELYLISGIGAGTFNGFKWNEDTTVTTPVITSFATGTVTTNTTEIFLNSSVDENTCVYWSDGPLLIKACDEPIDNTSIVGAWNLGEGDGNSWITNQNISDYSGNGNDGINNGSEYVRGRFEKGMCLDGIASNIEIDNVLDTLPPGITISFWFNHNAGYSSSSVTNEILFQKVNVNLQDRIFGQLTAADGKLYFRTEENNNGVQNLLSTTNTWVKDTWYYAVFTWDTTNGKQLWVNAELEGSDVTETTLMLNGTSSDFFIGSDVAETLFADITIDEFRIYNRSISGSEIRKEFDLSKGFFNWTFGDEEKEHTIRINVSDSYINASASSAIEIDYTDVLILNETGTSILDEDMNIQLINRSTFGVVASVIGTNGTFRNIDDLIGQRIVVRASNTSSSDFEGFREIEEPAYIVGRDFTIYMPKTSVDTTGFHKFKIRDFTTDWSTANIIFRRDLGNGLVVIQESFVDVENKVSVYLIKDREYQIVVNKSDDTRIFGFYKAEHDSLTSLLEVELNMVNITEWTDRQYLNKDINFTTFQNGTTIFFAYDNVGITSTLQWWVFNGTNRSQLLFSTDANGSSTALFSYSPDNANETFFTMFCANNSIFGFFCKSDTPKAVLDYDWLNFGGPRIPTWGPTAAAIAVILVIAGIFGGVDSKSGGIVLAGSIVFFWYIGWLDLGTRTQGIAIVGLVMFMAVLNKLTEGAR